MIEIKISDEVMEQYETDYLQLFEQVVLEHAAVGVFQPGCEIPIDYMKKLLSSYSSIFSDLKLKPDYMVGLFHKKQGKYILLDAVMILKSYYRKYIFESSLYDYFEPQCEKRSEFKPKLDRFMGDIHYLFEEIIDSCYEPNCLDLRPINLCPLTHGSDQRSINIYAAVIEKYPNFPVKLFATDIDSTKTFEFIVSEPQFMRSVFSLVQFISPWCEDIFYEHTIKTFEQHKGD